ncbi:NAD-dependent protein deacylase [Clostridium uliginosum]|uniref:NAD-dependent protein deacetylase n=1 Tax=Clostridium uliginosum TaxID=119641 RepID=A0A1I1SAA2_9CLOT|nr:NAD-dependent protein deacylase [Clostridium uliginosum]SFD43376.1 NAD-dependent deacetylase [Clostridium uliginosum]
MNIEKLSQILKESDNIVFFGGAGMSTESGIADFRSENGLYKTSNGKGYPPETMLSHGFFISHPSDFFNFYKEKMIYTDAKPNAGHLVLAKLEQMSKLKAVITQNIDGLHQAAGSKNVYELHGSVHRNYCIKCHTFYDLDFVLNSKDIPKCPKCNGIVKPDVVLYEEGLNDDVIRGAVDAIEKADTLIIGGTSLVVYPAAGLINYFRGKNLVLINKSSTPYDSKADLVIHESIGEVLSQAVKLL